MPEPTYNMKPPRMLSLALFLTGLIWAVAANVAATSSANGITRVLSVPMWQPLLHQAFFAVLLMVGFTVLRWISTRAGDVRSTNALPKRATAWGEFRSGAALGWAMLLLAVLPMVLAGTLTPAMLWTPHYWLLAVIALAALALAALASEIAFHGYLFRNLIEAMGPTAATIVIAALYALASAFHPSASGVSILATFALGLLFAMAYLRTHALWLGWGLHFAWAAMTAVVFGLPLAGSNDYSSVVQTDAAGKLWLTGGFYGPEGSVFGLIAALVAMPVLFWLTREYAWEYTHEPIVAAGYAMEAKPPAAHVAMEAQARPAAAAPLVQILGSTPTSASTMAAIDEHLRSTQGGRDNE